MRLLKPSVLVSIALMVAASAATCRAGTNLLSTNVVGGNSGWFSSGVWKTNNGAGVPIGSGVSVLHSEGGVLHSPSARNGNRP